MPPLAAITLSPQTCEASVKPRIIQTLGETFAFEGLGRGFFRKSLEMSQQAVLIPLGLKLL